MISSRSVLVALGLAAAAGAQSVQISIAVRETGFASGPFTNIGDNGGATGGIEWVNRDGQTLNLDGTAHTVVGVMPPGVEQLAGMRADLWPAM